jgi:mannose-6-phosphate isomerase-like protein (cupin superfamily)
VDGERRLIRANNITYIPPGVVHEFHNARIDPLVFLVVTGPRKDEEPRPR